MDAQLEFLDCTLSTENQAVVNAVNKFLTQLPDNQDSEAALRLAMELLETADIAPQVTLARAIGLHPARSVRSYKERLRSQGLAGLFDRPIPGRPAITTPATVEHAVMEVIIGAVLTEHHLPADAILAERVNQVLGATQGPAAGTVTASVVETIRLRWGIRRQGAPQPDLTPALRLLAAPARAQSAPVAAEPTAGGPELVQPGAPAVTMDAGQAARPARSEPTPAESLGLPELGLPTAPMVTVDRAQVPAGAASVQPTPPAGAGEPATVRLGQTRVGGAFIPSQAQGKLWSSCCWKLAG